MKNKFTIFKNNNFLRFAIADFISGMGTSARTIAIPLFVFMNTKSYLMMTIAMVLTSIPTIILGPIAGKCADKYNKKYVMVCSDLFRGVLDILLFLNIKNVYFVVAIGFFMSIGNVFFNPAARSIIPNIVEKDMLNDANSIFSLLGNICSLVGPILGGILSFRIAIMFDSITFLISAIFLVMLDYAGEEIKENSKKCSQKLGVKELIDLLKNNRQLEVTVYMTFIMALAFSMIPPIMPGYVISVLGAPSKIYSIILSGMCLGGLFGALINTYINKKYREEKIYVVSYGVYGVIYALLIIFKLQYMAIILFFIQGITMPIMGIAAVTIEQKLVDKRIMGRFFGITTSIQAILGILGKTISGFIAQYVGCLGVFMLAFILMSIGVLIGVITVRASNNLSLGN